MARGKSAGGAKRGPKPHVRREDLEAFDKKLSSAVRRLTKLVRAIHAEVVPGSTEGTPEPEPVEAELAPAEVSAATPAAPVQLPLNGTSIVLPVEAEVVVETPISVR